MTRQEVWEMVVDRVEKMPCDGMSADGEYSEFVHAQQMKFVDGFRSGALAVLNKFIPKKVSE
jgi:hypothetical protein